MQETEDIVTRLEQYRNGMWPVHECLRLAEAWTTGVDLDDLPQWRIVVAVLAQEVREAATTIATLRAEAEGLRWRSVDDELPPMNTEVLVAFDTRPLPATAQLTMHKGMRQWLWPAENDATEGEEPVSVTHWMPLPDHPNEERFAAIDAAKADKEGA